MSNLPEKQEGTGLYRTEFKLVVLSESSIADMGLDRIAFEIQSGDSSGRFTLVDEREIGKRDMALALIGQGSEPSFLLGDEEGFAFGLEAGDEVTWNDPDEGACTTTGIIGQITFLNDEVVRIVWRDGGELEARISELS